LSSWPAFQQLLIDPAPITSNRDAQFPVRIFQLNFDTIGTGVPKSVGYRLASDAVYLIANNWMQCTRLPFYDDP